MALIPHWLLHGSLSSSTKPHLGKMIFLLGIPVSKYNEKTVGLKSRLNLCLCWCSQHFFCMQFLLKDLKVCEAIFLIQYPCFFSFVSLT